MGELKTTQFPFLHILTFKEPESEADGTTRISKKVAKFEAIARLKAVLENEKDHFKFCIDLQFESLMIEKELTHLARQLSRSYGFNKTSDKPCHLTLASLNKSSKTFQVCCDKNDGFANYILNQSEQAVHELYDKDSIVYLTPDSDQVITYLTG